MSDITVTCFDSDSGRMTFKIQGSARDVADYFTIIQTNQSSPLGIAELLSVRIQDEEKGS